jgi:hypothetical protein
MNEAKAKLTKAQRHQVERWLRHFRLGIFILGAMQVMIFDPRWRARLSKRYRRLLDEAHFRQVAVLQQFFPWSPFFPHRRRRRKL